MNYCNSTQHGALDMGARHQNSLQPKHSNVQHTKRKVQDPSKRDRPNLIEHTGKIGVHHSNKPASGGVRVPGGPKSRNATTPNFRMVTLGRDM